MGVLLADGTGDLTWTRVWPAGETPAPRAGHVLVADPGGAAVWLAGGRTADGVAGDLWRFDVPSETWARYAGTATVRDAKLGRWGGCATVDPQDRLLYWYGGLTGTIRSPDTSATHVAASLDDGRTWVIDRPCEGMACPPPAASCSLAQRPDGTLVLLEPSGLAGTSPTALLLHPAWGGWHTAAFPVLRDEDAPPPEPADCDGDGQPEDHIGGPCMAGLSWWDEPGTWSCGYGTRECQDMATTPVESGDVEYYEPIRAATLQDSLLWTQTDTELSVLDLTVPQPPGPATPHASTWLPGYPVDVVGTWEGGVSLTEMGLDLVWYSSSGLLVLDTLPLAGGVRMAASGTEVHVQAGGTLVTLSVSGGSFTVLAETPLPAGVRDLGTDGEGRLLLLGGSTLGLFGHAGSGGPDPLPLLDEAWLPVTGRRLRVDGYVADVTSLLPGVRYSVTSSGALVEMATHELDSEVAHVRRSPGWAILRDGGAVHWVRRW